MQRSALLHTTMFVLLALLVLPFSFYSIEFGQGGLRDRLPEPHYLLSEGSRAKVSSFGVLTLLAAIQTIRHAQASRLNAHAKWALRFFWLAIGSWLYRVHYGLWYLTTDGLWSNAAFTGVFDLIQNFAFYVPYLIGLEIYLARKRYRVVVN